jgi:riboflavin synthase
MFTGIITDIGEVRSIVRQPDIRLVIGCGFSTGDVAIGASIACSGICLTVVEKGDDWFAVDASLETESLTTIGDWVVGTRINLERALRFGDELGGHIVSGHVDGVARIVARFADSDSWRYHIAVPEALAGYVAAKGSVSLDGVSLTVNEVTDGPDGTVFGINLIPHTIKCTTFDEKQPGHRLNMEVDMLARYVARLTARASLPTPG